MGLFDVFKSTEEKLYGHLYKNMAYDENKRRLKDAIKCTKEAIAENYNPDAWFTHNIECEYPSKIQVSFQ